MKTLTTALRQMLDTLAFARAGGHLGVNGKTQVLTQRADAVDEASLKALQDAPVRACVIPRRVAFYLGSELSHEVMCYVIETCARLQYKLTVLSFQYECSTRELLFPYQQMLDDAGVEMELVTLKGDSISGLGRYLRKHREIAFLACKDTGYLGRNYLRENHPQNTLPVPVVVVTTANKKINQQANTAFSQHHEEAVVA